jgi:excinuclease UvrABC ATPase subunit
MTSEEMTQALLDELHKKPMSELHSELRKNVFPGIKKATGNAEKAEKERAKKGVQAAETAAKRVEQAAKAATKAAEKAMKAVERGCEDCKGRRKGVRTGPCLSRMCWSCRRWERSGESAGQQRGRRVEHGVRFSRRRNRS